MNKALIIWNAVLTVLLFMMVISGCTALDPQLAVLPTEVKNNRALIEQVLQLVNSNREAINSNSTAITKNTLMISSLRNATEAAIAASEASLRQLIQQYLAAQQ